MRIKDYAQFLTQESLRRQPSAIRALQPLMQIPGMISLGGGVPHPETFPFRSLSFTLRDGSHLELSESQTRTALQYGATSGQAELVGWLKGLQMRVHRSVGYAEGEVEVCVFNGSQDGLAKAFDMLVSPSDHVLVESPMYRYFVGLGWVEMAW